jgi:transcriptional regulator with XRE-family HTH domain
VNLGKVVKQVRMEREMSQAGLAKKAKLNHSFVSRLESGERLPTLDVLARIAKALRVSVTYLVVRADTKCVSRTHALREMELFFGMRSA